MAELREDTQIWPLLLDLTECLCAELEASGLTAKCRCIPIPGDGPVLDFCGEGCDGDGDGCSGQAWVRLVQAYPAFAPGVPALEANSRAPLGFNVEIGVARCFVWNSEDDSVILDGARKQMADMAAMRRAIVCCFKKNERDHVLGAYTPMDADGGCLWSVWDLAVGGMAR